MSKHEWGGEILGNDDLIGLDFTDWEDTNLRGYAIDIGDRCIWNVVDHDTNWNDSGEAASIEEAKAIVEAVVSLRSLNR